MREYQQVFEIEYVDGLKEKLTTEVQQEGEESFQPYGDTWASEGYIAYDNARNDALIEQKARELEDEYNEDTENPVKSVKWIY